MAPVVAALPTIAQVGSFASTLGSIGSAIGAVQSLGGGKQKSSGGAPAPAAEAPFVPKKPEAVARPTGLGLEGYDPAQERSALATKGINVGLGKDEDAYYKNLVSRSLIGDDNKVTGTAESLLPVESQYFSGRGIDTSNINNLLKAIMGG
jgi:hypothetical protein